MFKCLTISTDHAANAKAIVKVQNYFKVITSRVAIIVINYWLSFTTGKVFKLTVIFSR